MSTLEKHANLDRIGTEPGGIGELNPMMGLTKNFYIPGGFRKKRFSSFSISLLLELIEKEKNKKTV